MGAYERCHAPGECFCMACQLESVKTMPMNMRSTSPPPDVVEAARRLEEIFKDYDGWSKQYAVTVCKWVLEKASGTS